MERQLRELWALYAFSQALYAIQDLEQLLQLAMEQVTALLEVESAAILLLDETRQELYFKVAEHLHSGVEQRLRKVRFPVPLQSRGRILGVVDAVNKRHCPFDAEDVRLLEAFGNPLAGV